MGQAKWYAQDLNVTVQLPDVTYGHDWIPLGSWITNRGEFADEVQTVYVQTEAVEAYSAYGAFPDGTVVVKDLFSAEIQDMTARLISDATRLNGWFEIVKDAQGAGLT